MFNHYNELGFINPYYIVSNDYLIIETNFDSIVSHLKGARQIDIRSLIEIISRYHCFAERTLVQGIYRTPWMAKPNSTYTDWEFADLPLHGDRLILEAEAAQILFTKLQLEILNYCEGRSTVGVLLSGGMDSRIAAGVLDFLLKTGQMSVNVVAITWGMEQTRDVIYARRIAQRLGWDWLHYPLSAEDLMNNITETAKRGCEYSPVHLHAMPRIRKIKGVDCILAASYGDSVGRAEYSGRHVTQLIPFEQHTLNWFKLLRIDAYKELSAGLAKDITRYRTLFPRSDSYQQHEIDQQAHYMRRKLNHCMAVINEKIPLLHVFSSLDVFGFMWSLSPKVRTNLIYKCMLDLFKTDLSDIPWARTGSPYLSESEPINAYPGLHHRYGEWIRGELYDLIREKALSQSINSLNIFNMQALSSALAHNRKIAHQVRATKMDEISIWLAALSEFVQIYNIQGYDYEQMLIDNINGTIVGPLQLMSLSAIKFVLSRE